MTRFKIMFLLLLFIPIEVFAATCDYEENAILNNEALNVKANYEIKVDRYKDDHPPDEILGTPEAEEYYVEEEYIQINILNLTENLYVVVTNDYDDTEVTYNYSNTTDGNISIKWIHMMDLVKYKIEVYTSDNTNCADDLLRTLYVSLPRYNDYSTYAVCDKVPDYYLCQRYVTYEKVEFVDFEKSIRNEIAKVEAEEKEKNEKHWYDYIVSFFENYWVPIVVIVVVAAGGTITYVIIRNKKIRGNAK